MPVMRGSSFPAHIGPLASSAFVYIVRKLRQLNTLPFMPTRFWRKSTGPSEVNLTNRAMTGRRGEITNKEINATIRDNSRRTNINVTFSLNPSEKISQLGERESTSI